jgi:hypothetical protein
MHLHPQHHAMRVVPRRVNKNDIAETLFVRDFASRTKSARRRCLRGGKNAARAPRHSAALALPDAA